VDGGSKRPYTIRGTERFATIRSQGSGGAAGRAVGGKIASALGRGVSGNQRPQLSFILPAVRDAAKGECERREVSMRPRSRNASPTSGSSTPMRPPTCSPGRTVDFRLTPVQPCGTQKAPEASSESVVPKTLQAIAEQHFKRGYSYIHEEIYTGCGIDYRDRYDMDEHFARYEAVKGLLEAGDREQCERTELHYKARASRLAARAKANFELHEALRHFAKPEVSCLLDAEDHDTLKRLEGVLVKVAPDFKAEFGSAPA